MGLGGGRGREPSTHCPRTWGTDALRTPRRLAPAPRRVPEESRPAAPGKLCSLPSPTARGMAPGSCHGKCHGKTWPRRPGPPRGRRRRWEDGVAADKLVWGLVRGRGEGARAHTLPDTRAHGGAHPRTPEGAGAHAQRGRGPWRLLPTPGDGTCRLGRGPGGSYRGSSAAVAFLGRCGS